MGSTLDWMLFQQLFGYGTARSQKLLDSIGHPSELFGMTVEELEATRLITARELGQFKRKEQLAERCEKQFEQAARLGCAVLTPEDSRYPQRLRNIYASPAVLYVLGNVECLDDKHPAIAIVGTRHNTDYGRQVAIDFGRGLAERGVTVVSGMAAGIDTVSHHATLCAGGCTVAVLGCGPDRIYPPANKDLHKAILDGGGAVVTEFPPGEPPIAFHFPIRNRIISGLSLGVVVVEGNRRSGSLITVGHAVTQGREVFAVPGSIYNQMSNAANWLISQGVTMASCVDDILNQFPYIEFDLAPESLNPTPEGQGVAGHIAAGTSAVSASAIAARQRKPSAKAAKGSKKAENEGSEQISFDIPSSNVYNDTVPSYVTAEQAQLLAEISGEPRTADALLEATGLPLPVILSALTQLELFGLIEACAGHRFRRI